MIMAVGVFATGIYLCRRYDCRTSEVWCLSGPGNGRGHGLCYGCECVERPEPVPGTEHRLVVGPTQNDELYAPLCDVIATQNYYRANASHDASFKLIYGKSAAET
jgi:hypothetical protein